MNNKYQVKSIFILETLDKDGEINGRGTCFAIAPNLLLTAKHVINNRDQFKCYLTADDYRNKISYSLEIVNIDDLDLDFALLKIIRAPSLNAIKLGVIKVSITDSLEVCGYPVEAGVYIPLLMYL